MAAFITGIGWVSKKSMGYPDRIQPFERDTTLPGIKGKDILDHPHKPFGRMDAFSKLGFSAIAFAMEDAGIKKDDEKKNVSLIASTVTGCLETDINFQKTLSESLPSPTIFAYTLASSFLGEAAIYFGLTGESFVINEEKTNGLTGLLMALEIIESGESDIVLCGTCNSDIKIINAGSHIIKPGSIFFVLEKKAVHSYGTVTSTSLANIYYQHDIKITGLYDLAQKCCNRKI
ncbi:beta-ketoacyl synthase N-terminal-like domain-containing protein [Desulfobacula sp.]|uniref:beta-ketoacyl synthase N-terminal-like domain-containing protein n=1 Tax=Desulfobacula sp. TaxID=2593537 RepID=UPI0026037564|nr:beta-ketoacyl synthase N-terminal-like domain-containing protein [Desulfobacula sp.]